MIVDKINNFGHYFDGLEDLGEFLSGLGPDTPEGRHELDEDNIFAIVSRYETRPREKCRPEAHKKYADIQYLISGTETLEWFPLEALEAEGPFDSASDVGFYTRPDSMGTQVELAGGVFCVLFPHDAHMPQVQSAGGAENVLKVVVKIRAELL